MKMLSAAAAMAVFTFFLCAAPAAAQSGMNPGGSAGSGRAVMLPARPGPAPLRGYEPGNFPVPGLPAFSGGIDGRVFGPDRFQRPDRPIRSGRPDRHRKRHREDLGYGYGYGIGFGGLIDPDRGYFATGGAAPEVVGRHVRYDYDRGYPYDHYYGRPTEPEFAREASARERYCETEWTRGRRAGEQVAVRICRN